MDKPFPEVITNQDYIWSPLSWGFLLVQISIFGLLLWMTAIGSVIIMIGYLLILLAVLAIAYYKGLIINWKATLGVILLLLLLIFSANYFVVHGPIIASHLIGILGAVAVLYIPITMTFRSFIFQPFIKSTIDERNVYMMKNLIDISKSNEYGDVCIIMGSGHLENFEELCDIRGVEYPAPIDLRS